MQGPRHTSLEVGRHSLRPPGVHGAGVDGANRQATGVAARRRAAVALSTVLLGMVLSGCALASGADEDTVRVYSGRHYDLEEAFEQFAEETGISVEFLNGDDAELRERLAAEGDDTEADVYMAVDAANLALAAEQSLFQPLESPTLDEAVPASLRDPQGRWFGLSRRARTIVYNPQRVDPEELSTYEDLADARWAGRVCMRNSTNVYTQSLVASLIAHHGKEEARSIVGGWVDNDVEIINSDVRIIDAIDSGACDVGVVNHYYLARMLEEEGELDVALMWANQEERGTHVNVSGAGVTRHADQPELAQTLIEWLATDGQKAFVSGNHEYPANPDEDPDPLIAQWGDFRADELNAAEYGALNGEAIRLMDEVGYR